MRRQWKVGGSNIFLTSLLPVLEYVRSGTFLLVFILSLLPPPPSHGVEYSIIMNLYNICYEFTPLCRLWSLSDHLEYLSIKTAVMFGNGVFGFVIRIDFVHMRLSFNVPTTAKVISR